MPDEAEPRFGVGEQRRVLKSGNPVEGARHSAALRTDGRLGQMEGSDRWKALAGLSERKRQRIEHPNDFALLGSGSGV